MSIDNVFWFNANVPPLHISKVNVTSSQQHHHANGAMAQHSNGPTAMFQQYHQQQTLVNSTGFQPQLLPHHADHNQQSQTLSQQHNVPQHLQTNVTLQPDYKHVSVSPFSSVSTAVHVSQQRNSSANAGQKSTYFDVQPQQQLQSRSSPSPLTATAAHVSSASAIVNNSNNGNAFRPLSAEQFYCYDMEEDNPTSNNDYDSMMQVRTSLNSFPNM